jgi:hypothetical protein
MLGSPGPITRRTVQGGTRDPERTYPSEAGVPVPLGKSPTMAFWKQDVLYAVRRFRKSLTFSIVATATLALGIGANTAFFGVINRTLIRPLPYPDERRLVHLTEIGKADGQMPVSYPDFLDWKRQLALGATRKRIAGSVFRSGFAMAIPGLGMGALGGYGGAVAAEPAFRDFGERPAHVCGALLPLLVAAVPACWLPARRAAKVDPVVALREE